MQARSIGYSLGLSLAGSIDWDKANAKIDTKIKAKSVPRVARGTQNRLKIGPGSLSGRPVATKSVPRASRELPRSVSGCPRRAPEAPGCSPRAPRDASKGAREHPGARRVDQNGRQVAAGSEKIEFVSRGSFAQRRRSGFSTIFTDFRFVRKVSNPSKVLRLPAKTEVRPIATRVESLARCNLEKPRKSTRKSTQNRRKSRQTRCKVDRSGSFEVRRGA